MKNYKKRYILLLLILLIIVIRAVPNLLYSNSGKSLSKGSHGKGSLENAYQVEFFAGNASYFSWISYYVMGNGYVNNRLYYTLLDAYTICEKTCPNISFKLMECSDQSGGKILLHNTHRNGLSVDFMTPLKRDGEQTALYDYLGLWHYLLQFDDKGILNFDKSTSIDFETMAKHILALDNASKKYGLAIKKVILKIELKDDFFRTKYGREVRRRGIYFARYLPESVNNMHDDHYHIDFKIARR